MEVSKKDGKVRKKRGFSEADFTFELVYKYEDDTRYVSCSSCGHDLRNEPTNTDDPFLSISESKSPKIDDIEIEWIGEAFYEEGFLFLDFKDFTAMPKLCLDARRKNQDIKPAVIVAGSAYGITIENLYKTLKSKNYLEKKGSNGESLMGIPRQCWHSI